MNAHIRPLVALAALGTTACSDFDFDIAMLSGQTVSALAGGFVCTPDDRAHVYIPPGALEQDTVITIEEVGVPAGLDPDDVAQRVYDFGPDGQRFTMPVQVSLRPEALPTGASLDELTLFNLSDGVTEALSDPFADDAEGTLMGWTSHFSVFYAALGGPVGTRGIHVGGVTLDPVFGSSSTSDSPPEVAVWISAGGQIRTHPNDEAFEDMLVIQVNSAPAIVNSKFFVDGWTVSPLENRTTGPTGEQIATSGFWYDYFRREIIGGLSQLVTDDEGQLVLALRGEDIYRDLSQMPAGENGGRMRLRVFAEDGPEAVDIYLALSLH